MTCRLKVVLSSLYKGIIMIFSLLLNLIILVTSSFSQAPALVFSDAQLVSLKPQALSAPWPSGSEVKGAVLAADERFFFLTRQADEVQPIASISKLMTALVFIEHNPGWEEVYQIQAGDRVEGGRLNLFLGERVRVRDLFYTSLVASDNGATLALVRSTGLSEAEFVRLMNDKAASLGLKNTRFAEVTGLSAANVSTAREVALLARAAFQVPEIRRATVIRRYVFKTEEGRDKAIESTDDLLYEAGNSRLEIIGGKTGYTNEAGYCYVGYMQGAGGPAVISVVLGAKTREARFTISRDLAQWVIDSFHWQDL